MLLESTRLTLRRFTVEDAAVFLALMNEPAFVRFVGDRQLRDEGQARAYLEAKVLPSYRDFGFGPYLAERRSDGAALGLCGLFRRETIEAPDLGFVFFSAFTGQGYAGEAAKLTMDHARRDLALSSLCAIVRPDNTRSLALLAKLGFAEYADWRDGPDAPALLLLSATL